MTSQDQVLDCVYEAIRDLNGQLAREERLSCSPGTVLIGDGGTLDSLSLINLLLLVEEALESRLGRRIALLDERYMATADGPFRTAGSLAEHASSLLASG